MMAMMCYITIDKFYLFPETIKDSAKKCASDYGVIVEKILDMQAEKYVNGIQPLQFHWFKSR